MTDLCFVRHAVAEERDGARWPDDSLRPVTADGAARFRRAARGLARLVPHVDVVLTSPYVRAVQTAEILCEESGWPAAERREELAAAAAPDDALALLHPDGGAGSIALVGHEPFLSLLGSLLLAGDSGAIRLELKKGAAVLLRLDEAGATLAWSAPPRLLRGFDPRR